MLESGFASGQLMEVIRRVQSLKEICRQAESRGRRIGLVPTMGSLHDGHISLIRRIQELSDLVVVSIFVNPTQFGPGEDYAAYPRSLTEDVDICIAEKVDYVFSPSVQELYPSNSETFVEFANLSTDLEGASRPGHFRGVATVVLKLFQIVQPGIAAFGRKDAQQALIIRRMVQDLMLDVEVLVLPTVREEDGLALSSRNRMLSTEQRRAALAIPRALETAARMVKEGQRNAGKVAAAAREVLEAEELVTIDYVELVDEKNLKPVSQVQGEMLLLVAASVGKTRLIDNVALRARG